MRASNCELPANDEHWGTNSGIHPSSAIRHEHDTTLTALAMLQVIDPVGLTTLTGAELLCRRAVQIQRAARDSPKAPSSVGHRGLTEHALDERGGLAVHDCHCAHRAFDAALGDRMRRLLAAALAGRLVI